MSLSDLSPAERHREIAGTFGALADGADNWDAPAPVDGWVARDVVNHLVTWLPALLSGSAGVDLPAVTATGPAAAWRAHRQAVQDLLDDPATPGRLLKNPHIGEVPLDRAIDQFYTTDVFLHSWDLARATGQDARLDPGYCSLLLGGMEQMDAVLRSSGQYGPRVPVAAEADPQTQLVAFIGRDPAWRP